MMIHKIDPHKYYPEFRNQEPKTSDYLLLFDGEKYTCRAKLLPPKIVLSDFCPPSKKSTIYFRSASP